MGVLRQEETKESKGYSREAQQDSTSPQIPLIGGSETAKNPNLESIGGGNRLSRTKNSTEYVKSLCGKDKETMAKPEKVNGCPIMATH